LAFAFLLGSILVGGLGRSASVFGCVRHGSRRGAGGTGQDASFLAFERLSLPAAVRFCVAIGAQALRFRQECALD
jgi:hypothetical protein